MSTPHVAKNAPVEKKVAWATAAAFLASLLLALLNALLADSELLGSLPAWLQFVLVAGAPTAVTFLGGWQATHTPR